MKKTVLLFVAVLILILYPGATEANFDLFQNKVFETIKATQDKVATLTVENDTERMERDWKKPQPTSLGSGFLVSKEGEIITNAHVVEYAKKITAKFGHREFEAEIIREKPNLDLALLKIKKPGVKFPFLEFGDSDKLQIGEFVLAIGSPFGLSGSVSLGIISNPSQKVSLYENFGKDVYYFIQTDTSINPGNSGGPLISVKTGKVIGVNSWIISGSGSSAGVGFAVPSNTVKKIIENDLDQRQTLSSGKPGDWLKVMVQDLTETLRNLYSFPKELSGVLVSLVEKESPLKNELQQGDLITELNGKKITEPAKFKQEIFQTMPGEEIKLKIYKKVEGKTKEISVVRR